MTEKFMTKAWFMAAVIAAGSLTVGCSSEKAADTTSELPFLELSTTDRSKFSEADLKTLELARDRMDPYVSLVGGRFQTSLTSGKDIRISEEVFKVLTNTMNYTNGMIKNQPEIINRVNEKYIKK
jgi:hypothetical protein